jgi:hypothetical protein
MPKRNNFKTADHDSITQAKRMLCRKIMVALNEDRRCHQNAAGYLGTSRAVISRMHNEHTDLLAFNQLFHFLVRLRPYFQILISARPNG